MCFDFIRFLRTDTFFDKERIFWFVLEAIQLYK